MLPSTTNLLMISLSQYVKELTNYPWYLTTSNNYLVDVQNPILPAFMPHPILLLIKNFLFCSPLFSPHSLRILNNHLLRTTDWWRISESNRWPSACKADALANWANPPIPALPGCQPLALCLSCFFCWKFLPTVSFFPIALFKAYCVDPTRVELVTSTLSV